MSAARRVRFGVTKRPPFENTHSLFAAEAGIAKTTFARVDYVSQITQTSQLFSLTEKTSGAEGSLHIK